MKTPKVVTEIAKYSSNFDNCLQKLADKNTAGKKHSNYDSNSNTVQLEINSPNKNIFC